MTPRIGHLAAALADGITLAADAFRHTRDELETLGLPDTTAKKLHALAKVYFGQTAFTGKQRTARDNAHTRGHSLATLLAIEGYTRRLKHHRDKWALRIFATSLTGTTSQIAKATRDKLKDIKGPPAPPKHGVTITRRAQGDCWTMNLHGPSKDITEIAQHIHSTSGVIDLIHHRTTTAAESTVPDSYTQPVACGTCGAETTARQIVSGLKTNVIIRLDELVEVFFGDGDDIKLKMTNGATIAGRDLCTRILADSGFITLIHPVHGPVNLYRTKRLASFKQRMMAMAEQPTCAWPGCNHPAETAQIHHLKSWKRGGNTNPDNLTVLCPYHNGINDDDNTPHRGQLTRTNGTIHYTPPWAA